MTWRTWIRTNLAQGVSREGQPVSQSTPQACPTSMGALTEAHSPLPPPLPPLFGPPSLPSIMMRVRVRTTTSVSTSITIRPFRSPRFLTTRQSQRSWPKGCQHRANPAWRCSEGFWLTATHLAMAQPPMFAEAIFLPGEKTVPSVDGFESTKMMLNLARPETGRGVSSCGAGSGTCHSRRAGHDVAAVLDLEVSRERGRRFGQEHRHGLREDEQSQSAPSSYVVSDQGRTHSRHPSPWGSCSCRPAGPSR